MYLSQVLSSLESFQPKFVCVSHLYYVCYMSCLSHFSWFNFCNYIWWRIQILKLLILYCFICFRSRYLPQHLWWYYQQCVNNIFDISLTLPWTWTFCILYNTLLIIILLFSTNICSWIKKITRISSKCLHMWDRTNCGSIMLLVCMLLHFLFAGKYW